MRRIEFGSVVAWVSEAYSANTYFIKDSKILVDPGVEESAERIKEEVAPEVIVNTHSHYDHTAGDWIFNIPVYIHGTGKEYLSSGDTRYTAAYLFGNEIRVPNELRDISEAGIEYYHLPGHSEDSVVIIVGDMAITGDLVFEVGVGRWDLPGGNLKKLKTSLEKLMNIVEKEHISTLLPGHGAPVKDPGAAVEQALKVVEAYVR